MRLRCALVLSTAVLFGGCRGAPPSSAQAVHYVLAWAWDGAARLPNGQGWEVTNDLGYRVQVTRGYLTTYSMELVECPKAIARLWSTLEGSAWAGHSSGTPNPAAIHPMQVESLLAPTPIEVGMVTLAPQTYCQLHYLVARAGHDSPGLPRDLDMVDASLHLDGSYRAPGSDAAVPFALHTAVANGGLFDRVTTTTAPLHVDTGQAATRVTVRRHLGALFTGVDFSTMQDGVLAEQILKSLIDHVEVEIAALG